jgi:hypothetical protein
MSGVAHRRLANQMIASAPNAEITWADQASRTSALVAEPIVNARLEGLELLELEPHARPGDTSAPTRAFAMLA